MKRKDIKRERVDSLIDHLWSRGYLTLSRKYGKYLPTPAPVGNYEIDAVGKYKKKIAVGLILSEEDLNNPNLVNKLTFIAKNKNLGERVTLFIGVPSNLILKAEMIIATLDDETKDLIKIVSLPETK